MPNRCMIGAVSSLDGVRVMLRFSTYAYEIRLLLALSFAKLSNFSCFRPKFYSLKEWGV